MNIALVTEYYAPTLGGIQEHVFHLRRELVRLGHRATIVTAEVNDPALPLSPPERESGVVRLSKSRPLIMNGSVARVSVGGHVARSLRELDAREHFDVLHLHAPLSPTLPLVALLALDTPAIGTFHTYFTQSALLRFLRRPLQRVMDRLRARIAVSQLAADAIHRYFRAEFSVIPNGVDCAKFAAAPPLEVFADGRPSILFVGRLEPRCGLEPLLEAMKLLPSPLDARLIVVGDGPLRARYEAAAGPSVEFAGPQLAALPSYYASASVVCVPFSIASFGITLLEAMAAGKPIVASDIPGFRSVMQDGVQGRLVDSRSPRALSSALSQILRDSDRRQRYGAAGRLTVRQYDWSLITQRIVQVYERAAG